MRNLVAVVAILISSVSVAYAENSYFNTTVRIYAKTSDGKAKGGTGFAIQLNGRNYIATCYHVVAQTEQIEVYSISLRKRMVSHIVAYDDIKDLALLTFEDVNHIPTLQIGTVPANLYNTTGVAIGNPDNNNEFILHMHFTTQSGTRPSQSLTDNSGHRIFKDEASYQFDVIPFDATIYGGMSGAPIIVNGAVIGVVSASINTGGSIGWGVPATYLANLSIKPPLKNGLSLSPLRSLANNNYSLVRSLVFDESVQEDFKPLDDLNAKMDENYHVLAGFIKTENSLINKFNAIARQISGNAAVDGNSPVSYQLTITLDSIVRIYSQAVYASNSFTAAAGTFDSAFSVVKNNYSSENIDKALAEKISQDLKTFEDREEIERIKYTDKRNEWEGSLTGAASINFYTPQSIITYLTGYINKLDLLKDFNSIQVSFLNFQNRKYKLLNAYADLLCESTAYKSAP